MTRYTKVLAAILLSALSIQAYAQKLPNKQENSIYAPSGIKIDGTADEWPDGFQAYNHATEVWYTLSNDEENLYFIFRATQEEVIQKIINGGITITIGAPEKKSGVAPATITYPVVPWLHAQVNYDLKPKTPLKDADVKALNKKINDFMKEIKISGLPAIPDPSISVYNDLGIKGAQHIDNQKQYTCEIVLPRSYVKHLISDKGTFAYGVQINGIDTKTTIVVGGKGPEGSGLPSAEALPHGMLYDTTPTYFNASYTLAQKS